MNVAEHLQRHVDLHSSLDELLADYIANADKLPSETTLIEFLRWSFAQTKIETLDHKGE